MQFKIHPLTLRLKEKFTISRDSYSARRALIVELGSGGHRGFGEASEHQYYGVSQANLLAGAERVRPLLEKTAFSTPAELWDQLAPHLGEQPFLQSAIDCAAHDLHGKILGRPCHQIWGLTAQNLPPTSFTLSIAPVEKMVEKLRQTRFDRYKIKLGTPQDMEILATLRQHTTAIFCIDANCAWTAEQARQYAPRMAELGVEFIEQPLAADDWAGMQALHAASPLPLFADEACRTEPDVERCAPVFHGINIKLMKCGGLTPALRMVRRARALGLQVMCGCMMESSVGSAAIAQLLPLLDYVDMDSTLFLTNDPATGPQILPNGTVQLPTGPGLGVSLR